MPTVGANITVEINSKTKFQPITPNIKKAPIFGKASLIPLCKNGWKKIKAPMANSPVLIIGTIALAIMSANNSLFFLNSLYNKLATMPATVHLIKQTITVPYGLIGIKMAKVDGDKRAIKPLKKPRIAADIGPHKTAAKTMVINDKFMFTRPIWK